jgi:hypothetical protein
MWDTEAVPHGTYFVSADVSDAITTTTWYSEVPVAIEDVPVLAASVLPGSRAVQVGVPATAFATIVNGGRAPARGVRIGLNSAIPARLSFQMTDAATNAAVGSPNTPVDIPAGGSQSFVLALDAQTLDTRIAPTDVAFNFAGANAPPVPALTGVNTFLYSVSGHPVPDIVALAATTSNDGIVNVASATGTGAFAVATVNAGTSGIITASADTADVALPVDIGLCQTNPTTGACVSAIARGVTVKMDPHATSTFAIFVKASGAIAFDPARNRVFVRFKDETATTVGSTSVALRTR